VSQSEISKGTAVEVKAQTIDRRRLHNRTLRGFTQARPLSWSLGSQCVPLLLVANKRHIKRNWSQKAISYLQKAKGCLLKTKES